MGGGAAKSWGPFHMENVFDMERTAHYTVYIKGLTRIRP